MKSITHLPVHDPCVWPCCPQNLVRPDEEEEEKTAKETAAAIQKLVDKKLAVSQPSTIAPQPGGPTYIKYTPSQQGAQYASGAKQRIIKMQDMPVDPLEPPKFRHTKVPRGTGSPPVPVMHSPPRPVTAQDQQQWKIPPCISNWKNAKGYTIPLDKRLAADGRGLQETTINSKFAGFNEALNVAESKAREAVELRAKVQSEMIARQKQAKEQELRQLAMQARMERMGGASGGVAARGVDAGGAYGSGAAAAGGGGFAYPPPPSEGGVGRGGNRSVSPSSSPDERRGGGRGRRGGYEEERGYGGGGEHQETALEREERRKRDEVREERRRERERERRLEARDGHGPSKKSKVTRDRERDVSEKVALGMANVAGGQEVQYDSRLFNQEQGMAQGFGGEDQYNLYDKPLFADRGTHHLFQRNKNADDEVHAGLGGDGDIRTEKFKADKGFQGAEGGQKAGGGVQYEAAAQEADPFGLDQFMEEVSKGGKGKKNALDGIGSRGGMAAGGGGGHDEYEGGRSRRMDFVSGSGR